MQTMVSLVDEREYQIATPIQRSSPPPPPLPEQPTPLDGPQGRTPPFWTWFIENPRPQPKVSRRLAV